MCGPRGRWPVIQLAPRSRGRVGKALGTLERFQRFLGQGTVRGGRQGGARAEERGWSRTLAKSAGRRPPSSLTISWVTRTPRKFPHIEARQLRQQVVATASTRRLQEEKLRTGRSMTLLAAQAQRGLPQSQIADVQAVINNRKAIVELTL